jgi:uncharacterized protein YhbP (UPF0306 family)
MDDEILQLLYCVKFAYKLYPDFHIWIIRQTYIKVADNNIYINV